MKKQYLKKYFKTVNKKYEVNITKTGNCFKPHLRINKYIFSF